jgi:hypothetical protein
VITCRQLVELLIDFVAEELPVEMHRHIQEHLRGCEHCHAYLESYRATIRLTRQLPPQPPPPSLLDRLKAALQGGQNDRPAAGS